MIEITPRGDADAATWHALLDLAQRIPGGWTLIGAQMVAVHASIHGRMLPRATRDFDVLADQRLAATQAEKVSSELIALGFALDTAETISSEVNHRFHRASDGVVVDVLAPDGLGPRHHAGTIPPYRTISVPGGTWALGRTTLIDVEIAGRRGTIPVPDILGAILIKARAIATARAATHRQDFVLLLSLLDDPLTARDLLTPGQRTTLRKLAGMFDEHPEAAASVPDPRHLALAERALAVLTTA